MKFFRLRELFDLMVEDLHAKTEGQIDKKTIEAQVLTNMVKATSISRSQCTKIINEVDQLPNVSIKKLPLIARFFGCEQIEEVFSEEFRILEKSPVAA